MSTPQHAQTCLHCGQTLPANVEGEIAKLPMRYRKAYRYMMANLREHDLGVRDLAEAAGVSERALQNSWLQFLRESPSVTIRRLRAEGIRKALASSQQSIDVIAEAWGIKNRGTVAKLFHDFYDCRPSDIRAPIEEGVAA